MSFPILRTGAVAQYPLDRGVRFQTQTVRFMDGSRQRYRIYAAGLRRWVVKLDLLDEQELGALIAFAEQHGSAAFAFTDPVTAEQVARCIISDQSFESGMKDEMNAQATLLIEEIV
jgi:phage-related protein